MIVVLTATSFSGPNPCELTCMAHGFLFFYNFGPVTDGTSCRRTDTGPEEDICVKGICKVNDNKKQDKNLVDLEDFWVSFRGF